MAISSKKTANQNREATMIKFKSRIDQPRSVYSHTVHGNVIAIVDHDQGRSVTNDADNVIDDLVRQGFDLSRYHVIYRDTRGIWDRMLTDRTGHFAGFSAINERDLSAALAKVTRH
jgi:hypothetical protein